VIIDEFGPQYHDFDLPVVDGLIQTPPGKPPATDAAGVQVTGRLLGDLLTAPDLRHRVSQIDVSSPHDVVVLLDTDTTLVHLGDAKFADRLRTFIDLAPALRERLADIDAVDMRFDERVYVRSRGRTIETKKKR
jgi:hypothetical protein